MSVCQLLQAKCVIEFGIYNLTFLPTIFCESSKFAYIFVIHASSLNQKVGFYFEEKIKLTFIKKNIVVSNYHNQLIIGRFTKLCLYNLFVKSVLVQQAPGPSVVSGKKKK